MFADLVPEGGFLPVSAGCAEEKAKGMQIVTFLSDWGLADHYVAVVKAKLFSRIPGVCVQDVSHQVQRGDLGAAAFVLAGCYRYFPPGTIHIVAIDDIASAQSPHVVVKLHDQFFIGADNGFWGIFEFLSGETIQEVVEIDVWQESDVFTFPARDLFCKVAGMLSENGNLERIGHPAKLRFRMMEGGFLKTVEEKDAQGNRIGFRLIGKILYIDFFGNACTNITQTDFEKCAKEFPFRQLQIGWRKETRPPVRAYHDVGEGDIAMLFQDSGFLEIAVNRGNAAMLLGLDKRSRVNLLFGQSRMMDI